MGMAAVGAFAEIFAGLVLRADKVIE